MFRVYPRYLQGLKRDGMATNGTEVIGMPRLLRAGDLLIDLAQLRVTRHGQVIVLPRLSFDLLLAMVRAAPRVLSPDELMQEVWPGLIVGSDTISQRVKLLRDALDDQPRAPRYIASIRGRGYQFIAPVELAPVEATPARHVAVQELQPVSVSTATLPAIDGPLLPVLPETRRAPMIAVLAIAGVAIFAGVLLLTRQGGTSAAAPVPIAVLPFATLDDQGESSRVLAYGVAEAVLHQLGRLPQLRVIAPASSLSIEAGDAQVRQLAAGLKADYVLLGSVQRRGNQLRVTARLVEASSERNLWSLRFDRGAEEIFDIQDQIAEQVMRALAISIDPASLERMRGQGTTNVEAYLAFLAGKEALGVWRTRQAGAATVHFERAVQLDPSFARAYALLARARLRDAAYFSPPESSIAYEQTRADAARLVERALSLQPEQSEAYIVRAELNADSDPPGAERDYRRALELAPSDAEAWQALAALLWDDPARRKEAEALIDRARVIDPLSPEHDVTKAIYRYYGYADIEGAAQLLTEALARNPQYVPALARLAELRFHTQARPADAARLNEKALELDPESDWVRRALVLNWVVLGDMERARKVAAAGSPQGVGWAYLAFGRGDYREAARVIYEAADAGVLAGSDMWLAVESIASQARADGRYEQAASAVGSLVNVVAGADGGIDLSRVVGLPSEVVTYADLLEAGGDPDGAAKVMQALTAEMGRQVQRLGRESFWHMRAWAMIAAKNGEEMQAIARLKQHCEHSLRCALEMAADPLFARLHRNPQFIELQSAMNRRREAELARALQP